MREPYWRDDSTVLYQGDARQVLAETPDRTVDCVVTSPPYLGQARLPCTRAVWAGGDIRGVRGQLARRVR
jgi:site-specific DNA-methyltransferase (cytosine-N4-specific)